DFIQIEALPRDLPRAINVDISVLTGFDGRISLADLDIPEGVTVLTPMDSDVFTVTVSAGQAEEEAEAAEAAEAAAEAAEAAAEAEEEGEEGAAPAAVEEATEEDS
ncbi:MAG: hypothetical protein GX558_12975, partial [Clostridiales bacterium]|nr:hypothetical protein [Clostridiales bacterium]